MSKLINIVKKNYKLLICIALLIVGSLVVLLNRGTYSVDEVTNNDSLVINCVDSVNIGEIFECGVIINLSSMITKGVTINFDLVEGLEFISFDSSNFHIISGSSSGVVLVDISGVNGSSSVGTLKFKAPQDAVINSNYKIELKNITVGDGEDTVINLDDTSDEVRINSDVNTLDSIDIEGTTLNEEFSSENFNYTANVDSATDKVNIVAVPTDENSIVSGSGELELHYGTNTVNITVRGENGSYVIYTIDILRGYEFSTEDYYYDELNNFIYTSTDNDDVILDNIVIPTDLNKKIENNKLIISYLDESLFETRILGVDFSDYSDKTIKISDDVSYENFDNIINMSEEFTYKLFVGENEVTEGNILNGTKLMLYHGDILLDEYDIEVYNLEFDSSLIVDSNNNFIKYLSAGTSVSEFLEKVNLVGLTASVISIDGDKKNADDLIATGDIFVTDVNGQIKDRYILSVLGDVNGDGLVDLIDLVQMRKHIVAWINPVTGLPEVKSGCYYYALDLNQDGLIDLLDLVQIRKIIAEVI